MTGRVSEPEFLVSNKGGILFLSSVFEMFWETHCPKDIWTNA